MSIRIETITDASQLTAPIREQWDSLPLPSPMQSSDWLLTWWETFGVDSSLQLQIQLVYFDDGEREQDGEDKQGEQSERLIGVAPFYLSDSWMKPKCLRMLGDDITCSDHATILVDADFRDDAIAALAVHLAEESGIGWHSMHLESIDQGNEDVRKLVDLLVSHECDLHVRATEGCWAGNLPATWDAYLATLSKNHRKRCRRWLRTYFDTGRATIVRRSVEDVAEGWNEIARLNEERRTVLGDRSAFAENSFHQFHLAILPQLLAGGNAELRELYIDGELKAAEYVMILNGKVFCYQSGMKTDGNRDGYGNLSIFALIRDAIANGCTQFDFLRGDEDYKHHWKTEKADCVHYHLGAPSLKGRVHVAWHRTRQWVRSIRDSLTQSSA